MIENEKAASSREAAFADGIAHTGPGARTAHNAAAVSLQGLHEAAARLDSARLQEQLATQERWIRNAAREASHAIPIAGTLAERYLHALGLRGPWPAAMRYVEASYNAQTRTMQPAIFAAASRMWWNHAGAAEQPQAARVEFLDADGAVVVATGFKGAANGATVYLGLEAKPRRVVVASDLAEALIASKVVGAPALVPAGAAIHAVFLPEHVGEVFIVCPRGAALTDKALQSVCKLHSSLGDGASKILHPPLGFQSFADAARAGALGVRS